VKHVWYVAYGSNLSRERFCHYIRGGRPDGSERDLPGCQDTSDPLDSFGVMIDGGVYFAGHSSGWRAGMAFYDPGATGEVAAKAYLITAEQFVDVLAQETRQSPGITLDLAPAFRGSRYSEGVGGYSILVRVGERRGVPLVTFTRDPDTAPDLAAPSAAYLTAMATGLREAHGWSHGQINRYLSALPGTARKGSEKETRRVDVQLRPRQNPDWLQPPRTLAVRRHC
jgi:hypothetical protein